MKRMLFVVLIVLSLFSFVFYCAVAQSMEVEPQVKYSIMQVRDNGDMHKNNMVGLGLRMTGGKEYFWEVSPEVWSSTQSGYETASTGYGVFSQVGYRFHYGKLEIIPVVGPYVGRWERGGNAKFSNSWTYVNYLDAAYGVNLNYKWAYAKLDLISPFVHQSNVRTSIWQEPREYAEVGIRLQNWTFGIFRRTYDFEKIDNNLYMHGIQAGYIF